MGHVIQAVNRPVQSLKEQSSSKGILCIGGGGVGGRGSGVGFLLGVRVGRMTNEQAVCDDQIMARAIRPHQSRFA